MSSTFRRNHRSEDIVAQRRLRGEIACAECRRLKMKCDRQIPCDPCIRRGCEHLCPNGQNSTGEGTRLLLAATGHLHEELNALRSRTRVLEAAVDDMHSARSLGAHPLLTPEQKAISESDLYEEAFGSATMTLESSQVFLHPAGGIASGMMSPVREAQYNEPSSPPLPYSSPTMAPPPLHPELMRCIRHFPFALNPPLTFDVPSLLRTHLPSPVQVTRLLSIFQARARSLCPTFTAPYIQSAILPAVYGNFAPMVNNDGLPELACIFAILGFAEIFATTDDVAHTRALYFANLALAAVGAISVFDHPSVCLVEALHAHAQLSWCLGRESGTNRGRPATMPVAWHLALTLGIHRDGALWSLPSDLVEQRSSAFWTVFHASTWQALLEGRSPETLEANIDAKFPLKLDSSTVWYAFTRGHVVVIAKILADNAPPTITEVNALDTRLRSGSAGDSDHHLDHLPVSAVLMYLHRAFFVRAVCASSASPASHEYGTSYRAAIRAADQFISWACQLISSSPVMFARCQNAYRCLHVAISIHAIVISQTTDDTQVQASRRKLDAIQTILETKSVRHVRRVVELQAVLTSMRTTRRYFPPISPGGQVRPQTAPSTSRHIIASPVFSFSYASPPHSPDPSSPTLRPDSAPSTRNGSSRTMPSSYPGFLSHSGRQQQQGRGTPIAAASSPSILQSPPEFPPRTLSDSSSLAAEWDQYVFQLGWIQLIA